MKKPTTPTSGPWGYDPHIGTIETEDGICIAECVEKNNGELLAAAPLMLEALQAVKPLMIPGMNWTGDTSHLIKSMVQNAIRKATL